MRLKKIERTKKVEMKVVGKEADDATMITTIGQRQSKVAFRNRRQTPNLSPCFH